MKYTVLLIALLAQPCLLFAQKKDGVAIEDRLLEWKDFKGKPTGDYYKASTYASMSYEPVMENNKYRYIVTCLFHPKESWVSKQFLKEADDSSSVYLLKHEQGHYDITRVVTIELEKAMNSFEYNSKKIRYQTDSIFRSYFNKNKTLQTAYDKDTNHSKVPDEQLKWNEKIKTALERKYFD